MSVYIRWKQRVLVFSVKLSNANPVSTCIGERLTLLDVVDFSCIFFFFFFFFFFVRVLFLFLIFFSFFCHSAISLFAFVLQTPFSILTCLGYVFAVNGKII